MRKDKSQDTVYVRKWRKEKVAQGWKHFAVLLPPEVLNLVTIYKNNLMDSYREGRLYPKQ